jgi:phosphatidylserine/phosphatidylglycerophosphate/cardiolipin synthase-like enzyme
MNIANALVKALNMNVEVRVIMDKSQTHGSQAKIHDLLEKKGANIQLSNPPGGIMHNKYLVVDGQTVEWGSYNYTSRAEHFNFENSTISKDPNLAAVYEEDFQHIWGTAQPEVGKGILRVLSRIRRYAH